MDPTTGTVTRGDFSELRPVEPFVPLPPPQRRWSDEEWVLLRLGFAATDMDDRWNAFVEGDTLFLHRSWTGHGIYEADFERVGAGTPGTWVIASARVVDDPEVYRRGQDVEEAHELTRTIEVVLAAAAFARGVEVPPPGPTPENSTD